MRPFRHTKVESELEHFRLNQPSEAPSSQQASKIFYRNSPSVPTPVLHAGRL